MRLRVAVVTPIFPIPAQPYRGHAEYQILRALAGHAQVDVICPFSRYPRWFRPTFDYRRPDLSYSPPGVNTKYFEYPALPGVTRFINGLVCAKYLEPYLRECAPDVIFNIWLYPEGYATVKVAHKVGIPAVVSSIGSDLNRITDPASRWLTRLAMDGAAYVVTRSEHLRQKAIQMGVAASKVRTVLNGCDSNVFRLSNRSVARKQLAVDEQAELVLFVGRLDTKKGILELLDAFVTLAKRRPNLRLTYAGDGPAGKQLQRKAKNTGLESRIFLANACSSPEVARWLAAANVLALPSYSEGCPSVVLEALSCGRPVIATNVGGIPELVNESCGILVAPRDTLALSAAIETALRRNWNEQLISEQFRRGWDQAAEEVLSICELAVRQRECRRRQMSYA